VADLRSTDRHCQALFVPNGVPYRVSIHGSDWPRSDQMRVRHVVDSAHKDTSDQQPFLEGRLHSMRPSDMLAPGASDRNTSDLQGCWPAM